MTAMHARRPGIEATGSIPVMRRVAALDWADLAAQLDAHGCAITGPLLTAEEAAALSAMYPADALFRSRIIMGRHGFGRGEYKYFAYPLPDTVAALREALYPPLVEVANRWNEALRLDVRYPDEHAAFLKRCHKAGQTKPTPLLLKYGAGDFNCLHQDIYGEHVFPLQVAFLLSRPGVDFTGGEFVLTEQRPRMQSRAEVVPLARGEGVIFPVHHRPVQGTPRHLPRHHAPRRQPVALRPALHRRDHLPRREVSALLACRRWPNCRVGESFPDRHDFSRLAATSADGRDPQESLFL